MHVVYKVLNILNLVADKYFPWRTPNQFLQNNTLTFNIKHYKCSIITQLIHNTYFSVLLSLGCLARINNTVEKKVFVKVSMPGGVYYPALLMNKGY